MNFQNLFKMRAGVLHGALCPFLILLIVTLSESAKASTPQLIGYQALLSDSAGNPLNQTVNVVFRIWSDSTGGIAVWTEAHNSTQIIDGKLSVLLGSSTPLDNALFGDTSLFLGIQIGGDSELSPRSRLATVPFAYRIGTISGASGGDVSGAIIISPDPVKALGDALIVKNSSNDTVLTTTVNVSGGVEIALFDPVDSKDGFAVIPLERVQISPDGIIMFDTLLDTTLNLSSQGDITGTGIITMGGGSGASGTTVLGVGNTAGGIYATVGGGASNIADGFISTVGGGGDNRARGNYSVVAGGGGNSPADSNLASGDYSAVGGGSRNSALGLYSGVFSGRLNRTGDSPTDSAAFVGGGFSNLALKPYATVAGGSSNGASGKYSFIGGGQLNGAEGLWATLGGGFNNRANDTSSTVGGGYWNYAIGAYATVAGGKFNTANGDFATVAGGIMDTAAFLATVGGGSGNNASGDGATIGGGLSNRAIGAAAAIGGGNQNLASASFASIGGGEFDSAGGPWSTIGGGYNNSAGGFYSTIPGGSQNIAGGAYSFAAGHHATASHAGSFVWADSSDTVFASSAVNQFNIRASGGVRIYTKDSLTAGVTMGAGASSWTSVSDKSVKRAFRKINSEELLEKLSEIPISRWKYIAEVSQADHIGPMSQDFYSAFGLGDDDKRISTIDADGVALAAIQALYKENQELKRRLDELELLIKQK